MWSAAHDPADSIVATVPKRIAKPRREAPRAVRHTPATTEVEISTLAVERVRASYRDSARVVDGGLRAVIRSSRGSSNQLYRRVGEVIVAVGVGILPIVIFASVIPLSFLFIFGTFVLLGIAGAAYGALPGLGRAMSNLYDIVASLTGGQERLPAVPALTVLDCHDGAELIVTRTSNRRHPSRVVVPVQSLASLRAVVARGRARLIVEHAGEEVVLADDLPAGESRALEDRLRRVGDGAGRS